MLPGATSSGICALQRGAITLFHLQHHRHHFWALTDSGSLSMQMRTPDPHDGRYFFLDHACPPSLPYLVSIEAFVRA